jgi:hypothetical protein
MQEVYYPVVNEVIYFQGMANFLNIFPGDGTFLWINTLKMASWF